MSKDCWHFRDCAINWSCVSLEGKKRNVVMIGSAISVRGGMSQVVQQILKHDWGADYEIRYLESHALGSVLKRCIVFCSAYLKLLLLLLLRNRQVDLFHLHMSYKGSFWRKYLLHRLLKRFHKRDIIHLHGSEFEEFYDSSGKGTKRCIRNLLRECDQVIVLGSYWASVVQTIQSAAKIAILPNAVELPTRMAHWQATPFRILYIGVLIPRKGISDLLYAFQSLRERMNSEQREIVLTIAGTGEQETELRSLCGKLHLNNSVSFAGWVDGEQKASLLAGSQCLVLPSYHEGLPVVLLEALSYGLPVVASDVGCVHDAVIDGYNGRLISPHALNELENALTDILSDPNQWEQMSLHGRQTVSRRFEETQFFRHLKELYDRLEEESPANKSQ